MNRIRVLIVDDSPSVRMLLTHVMQRDPRIEVVGTAADGQGAIDFLAAGPPRPDVVLMDIHMPKLDGFEATRQIMETNPLPIVICTATADPQELAVAFRSMEAGAVACVEKPVGPGDAEFESRSENLRQTIVLMAEVKVVRRWAKPRAGTRPRIAVPAPVEPRTNLPRIVGIGASTGGPPVLQTILSALPRDFGAPLLIVQHIARGFLPGMVEWLNQTTGLHVHIAAHGAIPIQGHAYIAPDDFHLGVSSSGRMLLAREAPQNGLRPSVAWLFRTLANDWGPNAVGVLLTGMGNDGAAELKLMRDRGSLTLAQDRETSVVHGMPGEAIKLGAAVHVLPADRIAGALITEIARPVPLAGGVES
ncbi:MAG TPA: chemotaxis-specific protein-glutamate methyltransferase CheB [Steroidobacteraceae bacterium]|nr:chemotaxis-specific protein-glutamate methyltransferase CheB [Steroidobacteraceae bacterium]